MDDATVFKKIGEMFGSMAGGRGEQGGASDFGRYPGFPIVRVRFDADGKKLSEEQVKSVKRGSLSADLFKVPAGYTKEAGPPMGPGGRGPRGGMGPGARPTRPGQY